MQPPQPEDTSPPPTDSEEVGAEVAAITESPAPEVKSSAFKRLWNWLWEKPGAAENSPPEPSAEAHEETGTVAQVPPPPAAAPPVQPADSGTEPQEPPPAEPVSPAEPPKPRIILSPAQPDPEPDEHTLALLRSMQPWVTIWRQPEQTIRELIRLNPPDVVVFLALLVGVNITLDLRFYILPPLSPGWLPSPLISLLLALVPGALVGLVNLYLWNIALHWAGGQLYDIRIPSAHLRLAIAWSTVPLIASIPLALVLVPVLLAGNSLLSLIVLSVAGIAELILFGWSFLLFVRSLSAVYRLSRRRALSVALLGALAIFVPLAFAGLVSYLAAVRSA